MGRIFTNEELDKILENHTHYVFEDCEGWEGMRADLSGANLNTCNLYGKLLCKANLDAAHLRRI